MYKVFYSPIKPPNADGHDILSERDLEPSEHHHYHNCPVWKHKHNRTFVAVSPIDFEIKINGEYLDYEMNPLYGKMITDADELDSQHPVLQLSFPLYYFWTEEKNLWVEMLDHPMTSYNNNMIVIGGWWNLFNHPRSVSTAVKYVNKDNSIIIKKGDPLYRIRFYGEDLNSGVKLLHSKDVPKHIIDQRIVSKPSNSNRSTLHRRLFSKQCPFKNFL